MCLGGFHNVRQEAAWQGFTLELDETRYEWGSLYELEAETVRACATASSAAIQPGDTAERGTAAGCRTSLRSCAHSWRRC